MLSNNNLICLQAASQFKPELREGTGELCYPVSSSESLWLLWTLHQNCL